MTWRLDQFVKGITSISESQTTTMQIICVMGGGRGTVYIIPWSWWSALFVLLAKGLRLESLFTPSSELQSGFLPDHKTGSQNRITAPVPQRDYNCMELGWNPPALVIIYTASVITFVITYPVCD